MLREFARFGHLIKTLARGGSFEYGATESAPYQPFGEEFGLTIIPNYISSKEAKDIRGAVTDICSRRAGEVLPTDGRYQIPPISFDAYESVVTRLERDNMLPANWVNNQTLNLYEQGDFIRSHIDNLFIYDDVFAIFSLGAHVLMKFVHAQNGEELEAIIPDRSIYILSGPARYVYFHMVLPAEATRISLVLRRSILRSEGTFRPLTTPLKDMMPYRSTALLNALYSRQVGGVRVNVDDSFLEKENLGAFDTSRWVTTLRPLRDWTLLQQLDEDEARVTDMYNKRYIDTDMQWRVKELREYFKGLEASMTMPQK